MAQTESTRCPHCRTAFRVTAEQLVAARGAVRCGSCLKVFNAREHLVSEQQPTPGSRRSDKSSSQGTPVNFKQAPEPTDSSGRFAADDDDELLFGTDDENDELVFMDDDEEPESEDLDMESNSELEFSDSFLELDESAPAKPGKAANELNVSQNAAADDSWALDMLADLEQEEKARQPSHHKDMRLDDGDSERNKSSAVPRRSSAARDAEHRQLNAALAQQELDELSADDAPTTESRGRWIALTVSILLVLVLQLLWWERYQLNQQPVLEPAYAQACQWLPCGLPESGPDAGAIRPLSSVLRPLPDGRMRLDAVFVNRSERAAPFPMLRLSIQDSQGETVADGLFAPEDYVAGELQPGDMMPSGRPVSISININQPVEDLNNFRLTFHY